MLTVSSCFQDAPTACAARHSSHFSNLHCLPSSAAIPFVMPGTIGFVGFGNVNSTLAEFAVKAGYRVIVSNSRGPASLAASVAKLGPLATAATVQDAVLRSDVVSVSIPFKNLEQLPAGPFNGKIVIDSMNYYPQRDGDIEDLDSRRYATSELVQQHLEGSHVVKAFHSIDQFHLRIGPRPVNHPDRWALPIAGDDADAKAVVASFVSAVGFDSVDCGSLAESWRIQQNTPVYCAPYVGELPQFATPREMYEWVKHDHSRSVKAADVRALAAKATTMGTAGQYVSDLSAPYSAMFSMSFDD
jgi:predicted dinucleotide-binding enzyme